jgi:hypothetical protein
MMKAIRRPTVVVITVLTITILSTIISTLALNRWLLLLSGFSSSKISDFSNGIERDENNVGVATSPSSSFATSSGTIKNFPKHSLSSPLPTA